MVEFKIKEHAYSTKDNTYVSVTTVIKDYKVPFDAIKISKGYAKKHPEKSAKEWRETWNIVSKESLEWGNNIHSKEEETIKLDPESKVATHKVDYNTITSLDEIADLEDGKYPELLIWDNNYNIAGLVDLVEIKANVVDITDYKTYKKVDLKSFFNPKTRKYSMMLEPLHMLHDCNYIHTALQVSTYAFILERLGYKIGKLKLLHLTRSGDRIPYTIDYNDFKIYVSFMLTHFKKNGSSN